MKIGPQDLSAYADNNAASAGRATGKGGTDPRAALVRAGSVAAALGAAPNSATVNISKLAASAMTPASAEVDMDKVRQVQAAVEQGTYRVNPDAIADELIANAQALLKPKV